MTASHRNRFDVAVIGGGHNGLVCAAYLAAAGLSVCVLERRTRIGGAAVTEEFAPGFRNSTASYTVSLLQQRVIDDLGLAAEGLRIVPRPLANFVPSEAGRGLKLPRQTAAAQAAIAEHSRRDAERYPAFAEELSAVASRFRGLMLEPPVDPTGGWREHLRAARRLPRFASLGGRGIASLWDLVTGSAGAWLDRRFESDCLKGALGFDSIVGHFASPYHAGSGYLLLHHALGGVDALGGAWGHAIGGMGAITEALAAAAARRGVVILRERDVQRITEAGGGYDVCSADGSVVHAGAVAAGVHPKILFERLTDPERLPADFRERIRHWRSESASFRANVALAELPDFSCLPGTAPAEHHAAGILITPGLDYLDRAWLDARRDGYSAAPVVELLIPSTIDDSLAPAGAHVASLFCQHFRRRLPDGADPASAEREWTDDDRRRALDRVIDTVSRYAPNFRRSIVAAEALSPKDLEDRFGLIGGDIFHGALDLDQLYWTRPAWGHAQYRTPLPHVYLCASGAHPGGGVSGAPGYNAAQVMLRDLARRGRARR
ncbi:MAG: NAD(P)/FAD-dependent oxidoreductase [Gammaproteobacteria bacterium]|nr:NAD(P)/FAD-dependent oxidoreductase [Gammaproteobacteria bacterium]